MRSLIAYILTEKPRSPWQQFLDDCLRGATIACICLIALILNFPQAGTY